jgi:predicted ATP-dependent serine protease
MRSSSQRISTGLTGFDYVMNGGLLAGKVVLLGGFAGTGKTTMNLSIADHIAKTQGRVIYATGEEGASDINAMADNLGLINDRVVVLGNQSCVEDVITEAKKVRAFLIFFDSAQEFVSERASGSSGSQAQCKAIGKVIKDYCSRSKTCAIVVNQMSGQGDLKGGTELEHKFDTVNILAYPKEDDEDAPGLEDEGYRVLLNANKNRGGVANLRSYWKMHGEKDPRPGFLEHVPARSKLITFPTGKNKYSGRKQVEQDEDDI